MLPLLGDPILIKSRQQFALVHGESLHDLVDRGAFFQFPERFHIQPVLGSRIEADGNIVRQEVIGFCIRRESLTNSPELLTQVGSGLCLANIRPEQTRQFFAAVLRTGSQN